MQTKQNLLCKCGKPATHLVGLDYGRNMCCEPCADRMIECQHTEGRKTTEYDSDGCGFPVWTCHECGYEAIDFS